MTQNELMELLNAHEWRDVEFKEAQRAVPRNAYETVSAFANTEGGHLVFGVKKSGQDMEVVGVLDVDKVQNEFLTTLRQPDKISVKVSVREELHKYDDSDLLVFYVPEVHRSHKPVFLNGDIRRSFVRIGGSDIRCSDNERNRFLMDAATERYDGQSVDLNLSTALDLESIEWYRRTYEGRLGNRPYATLSDKEFLNEMGLLVEEHGQVSPSHAAILFQASLGVQLTDEQARVFAFGCREQAITLSQIKAVTGLAGPDARELAEALVTKVLFRTIEADRKYALAEHLEDRFRQTDRDSDQPDARGEDLSTAQVQPVQSDLSTAQVPPLTELSAIHWKIIDLCDVPRRLADILEALGVTNRGYFKERHLDPLIKSGIVAMTNPEKPRASNQQYVITEAGARLKARRMLEDDDRSEDKDG